MLPVDHCTLSFRFLGPKLVALVSVYDILYQSNADDSYDDLSDASRMNRSS
jgi:hypothetical protein